MADGGWRMAVAGGGSWRRMAGGGPDIRTHCMGQVRPVRGTARFGGNHVESERADA
ncbi:hypothetical protein [Streptomyces sp900105755]|uniref:Uncharacterized protein n=1 Tax=Streptomyces sp. 900105755 TaxID=3154389 RepID=A0ABV1THQ2_9ACTN